MRYRITTGGANLSLHVHPAWSDSRTIFVPGGIIRISLTVPPRIDYARCIGCPRRATWPSSLQIQTTLTKGNLLCHISINILALEALGAGRGAGARRPEPRGGPWAWSVVRGGRSWPDVGVIECYCWFLFQVSPLVLGKIKLGLVEPRVRMTHGWLKSQKPLFSYASLVFPYHSKIL